MAIIRPDAICRAAGEEGLAEGAICRAAGEKGLAEDLKPDDPSPTLGANCRGYVTADATGGSLGES